MSTTLPLSSLGLLGIVVLGAAAFLASREYPARQGLQIPGGAGQPPLPPGCECKLRAPGLAAAAGQRAELCTARGRTARGTQAPPPPLRPQARFSLWSSGRTGSGSHAVGIGDRAGFRSRGGVSRRAQNLLRTQESTSEEQVSGDSWREARPAAREPRASHPGARKAARRGSGTRTPCPCPGAEGELIPRSWGP